jgi:DNA-binding CsgD family transcriptional regulator
MVGLRGSIGDVVGRERELSAVARCLDSAQTGFCALLVLGEAGIGKTTVWREAVGQAGRRGMLVLSCRPVLAETKLAFASLSDLLAMIAPELLAELPEPQRHALAVALLRESPRGVPAHSRAVGAGLVSVLRSLSERVPVLVAIDDAQWLDRASSSVLAFAIRRLEGCRVAVVAAERLGDGGHDDGLLLGSAGAQVIRLGPLSLSGLYHVIRQQLGLVFPRPALQRIEQASGGNPLFALELAEALNAAGGRFRPGEPLPVPSALADLMRDRNERLPEASRDALLVVASSPAPTTALLESIGRGDALGQAVLQGVVEVAEGTVRFRHPLLAETLVASASIQRRRAVHHRLAQVVGQPEERARHLALAAEATDEDTAASLEDAAEAAERRGAPEAAAELLDLARRLTPREDQDAVDRRAIALARVLHRAGDTSEARRHLDEVAAGPGADVRRAEAVELLAELQWVLGSDKEAAALCERALSLAGNHRATRARALTTLARVSMDPVTKLDLARRAVSLIEESDDPDPALLSEALLSLAEATFHLDRGLPVEIVERGLELEEVAPPGNVGDRMSAALGTWLKYSGDFVGARHWLERTHRAALNEGDEGSLPFALSHLPQLELWMGNWDLAEQRALEHLELAERAGQATERLTAIYSLTTVLAHRGAEADARAWLEVALPEAERVDHWNVYQLMSVLGFLELSLGRVPEAVRALGRAFDIYRSSGYGDLSWVYENYAEALVLDGSLAAAEEVIDLYQARAHERDQPMSLGPASRCRAELNAARGDLASALAVAEEAEEHGRRATMPFGLARTQLVRGQLLRRTGERRAARDALQEALRTFDELGAPLWAAKASAELARVPIKRKADSSLTVAESRIAELVARGSSNKEVAQALFVSEKTVEAALTRVFRKLDVRSRTELAARLGGGEPTEAEAKT